MVKPKSVIAKLRPVAYWVVPLKVVPAAACVGEPTNVKLYAVVLALNKFNALLIALLPTNGYIRKLEPGAPIPKSAKLFTRYAIALF